MRTTERVVELEAEQAELEETIRLAGHRLRAVTLELNLLRAGEPEAPDLVKAGRTDAVVSVIAAGEGPLRPSEILEALRAAGREGETLNKLTATLGYLVKQGRLRKIEPHSYLAV